MSNERKPAAIDADELANRKVSELSAKEFVALLHAGQAARWGGWGDKKKLELWAEPEGGPGIAGFGRLIDIIRGEKKKVEREVPFQLTEELIENIAERVSAKLQKK